MESERRSRCPLESKGGESHWKAQAGLRNCSEVVGSLWLLQGESEGGRLTVWARYHGGLDDQERQRRGG